MMDRAMPEAQIRRTSLLVSFSGIDGAGKSTQIKALCSRLQAIGLEVETIAFWDCVARFTQIRETVGRSLFKGDKGVGTPVKPIVRHDKNVRIWPMAVIRLFLYLMDAVSARIVSERARRSGMDVIIFDRWIYDELANLNLDRGINRTYAKMIAKLVPRPDVSFVLDAEPKEAHARKPEYPVEFQVANRASFLHLGKLIDTISILPAGSATDTGISVAERILTVLSLVDEKNNLAAMSPQPEGTRAH
jgi:thymidylate kinase